MSFGCLVYASDFSIIYMQAKDIFMQKSYIEPAIYNCLSWNILSLTFNSKQKDINSYKREIN